MTARAKWRLEGAGLVVLAVMGIWTGCYALNVLAGLGLLFWIIDQRPER